MSKPVDTSIPTVIIVGAGLGGLMLGAILENANISYHILERASELRSLGSAISLSGNIFPLFEQLGIYEELKSVSLPSISMDLYDTKRNALGSVYTKEHNMVMRKKVLSTKEHDNKVTVYCSDNTEYEYRILVGADGAYSAVRQNMYKTLEEQDRLPLVDKEDFTVGYVTMVGVSKPTNPEKYPQLAERHRAYFRVTIGDNNDSLLPGAGQGAVMAMKDAVVLANCIYNMKDVSDKSVKTAFASYYRQRYPEAEGVTKTSSVFTKVMFGHVCISSQSEMVCETDIMEC
ncbi:hypothetical protein BGZ80_000412 [Entomortierella chlamydospora]|uniref:FAD-binding domain-containing protein n=1 Tax=Entomortierella chlamydospora TaxID=101097 RepID=A0A9P6SYH1_9FUNG|nr:hypothetical protein BGZ80_000412 [Entomortierella chlamydospora]